MDALESLRIDSAIAAEAEKKAAEAEVGQDNFLRMLVAHTRCEQLTGAGTAVDAELRKLRAANQEQLVAMRAGQANVDEEAGWLREQLHSLALAESTRLRGEDESLAEIKRDRARLRRAAAKWQKAYEDQIGELERLRRENRMLKLHMQTLCRGRVRATHASRGWRVENSPDWQMSPTRCRTPVSEDGSHDGPIGFLEMVGDAAFASSNNGSSAVAFDPPSPRAEPASPPVVEITAPTGRSQPASFKVVAASPFAPD